MQFAKDSSKIIKHLIPNIEGCGAYNTLDKDPTFTASLENLLSILYSEIHEGHNYVKTHVSPNLKPVLRREIITPVVYGGKYFPDDIKGFIDKNIMYQLVYYYKIGSRTFKILFGICTDKDMDNIEKYNGYAEYICNWLYICNKFSPQESSTTMSFYIYLTSFKKTLPRDGSAILSSPHVNTAYTYGNREKNEIIIFREEEWKKTFIHETFHSFNFDFRDREVIPIQEYIKSIYPVQSDYLICEAYAETWSRILNAVFSSYYSLKDKDDKTSFFLYAKFTLQCERLFSILQLNKMLGFMNMEYSDLTNLENMKCDALRKMYREDSNVLSYYIVTGLFMNDYHNFLQWCSKNNSNIFRFTASVYTVDSFIGFMKEQYGNPSLLRAIDCMKKKYRENKKYLKKTTRMSAVEINPYLSNNAAK